MTTMQVQKPQPSEPVSLGRRIANALTDFIHRFRFVLWGVLASALAFLVVWFAWSEITRRQSATATRQVEQAQRGGSSGGGGTTAPATHRPFADLEALLKGKR